MSFYEQLQAFIQLNVEQISRNLDNISEGIEQLCITQCSEKFLIELSNKMLKICESEPPLLKLDPPITIVGDLHGHILNLFQILQSCDTPPITKYLFLGDIVDRGPFSLEIASLIFAFKVCYPEYIYIIRGNHEFSSVSLTGGFFEEVTTVYNSQNIFNAFNSAFEYFPIAALIGSSYLCLHGGISPDLKFLSQLFSFQRPIKEYSNPILCGLFWSDPQSAVTKFQASGRGVGFLFGSKPLEKFLNRNNLQILIRGHECVDGYSFAFDQKCITVFSASNYCGKTENHSAVLQIMDDSTLTPIVLKYLKYIQRSSVSVVKQAYSPFGENSFNSYINLPLIKVQGTRPKSTNLGLPLDLGSNLSIKNSASLTSKKNNFRTESFSFFQKMDDEMDLKDNKQPTKTLFVNPILIPLSKPQSHRLIQSQARFTTLLPPTGNVATKWRTNNIKYNLNIKSSISLDSENFSSTAEENLNLNADSNLIPNSIDQEIINTNEAS